MSMPAKRAPVYIRDKRGELVYVYTVNNLVDLFEDFPDVRRVRDEEGKVKADAVLFHVEGIVDGMQLSSHHINLTSQPTLPPTQEGEEGEGGGEVEEGGGEGGEGDGGQSESPPSAH